MRKMKIHSIIALLIFLITITILIVLEISKNNPNPLYTEEGQVSAEPSPTGSGPELIIEPSKALDSSDGEHINNDKNDPISSESSDSGYMEEANPDNVNPDNNPSVTNSAPSDNDNTLIDSENAGENENPTEPGENDLKDKNDSAANNTPGADKPSPDPDKQKPNDSKDDSALLNETKMEIAAIYADINSILEKSSKGSNNLMAKLFGLSEDLDAIAEEAASAIELSEAAIPLMNESDDLNLLCEYESSVSDYQSKFSDQKDKTIKAKQNQDIEQMQIELQAMLSLIMDYEEFLQEEFQ